MGSEDEASMFSSPTVPCVIGSATVTGLSLASGRLG